jgi:hypothetical protein
MKRLATAVTGAHQQRTDPQHRPGALKVSHAEAGMKGVVKVKSTAPQVS